MRFIVIGKDGSDNGALERRIAAREEHLKQVEIYSEKGNFLMATAILDEQGNMCGSIMLVDFPSRAELNSWLEIEPYVKGGVWKNIEIYDAKVAPKFEKLFE